MRSYIVALTVFGIVPTASATEIFDDTVSTCTGINCSSLRIPGSILNHVGVSTHPWVAQIFKEVAPCMRLDVTFQDADLEIVAVAPDGAVYRNDDRAGANDLRPLVVVPPNTAKGWYTVQISNFNGSTLEPNFILLYGEYTGRGNPNCANPTVPFLPAARAKR